jgi:hypothetical protein
MHFGGQAFLAEKFCKRKITPHHIASVWRGVAKRRCWFFKVLPGLAGTSKQRVAGSNPAGIAKRTSDFYHNSSH